VNVVSWKAYQINEPLPVISIIVVAFLATLNCRDRRRLIGEKLSGLVLRRRVCGLKLRISAFSAQGWGLSGQQNRAQGRVSHRCVLDMKMEPVSCCYTLVIWVCLMTLTATNVVVE